MVMVSMSLSPHRVRLDSTQAAAAGYGGAVPDVTVYIASRNTAACTELTIRTAVAYAAAPHGLVVGDGGSMDGSVAMLQELQSQGLLAALDQAPDGREHFEWLDHWVAVCPTRWAVFVDSDVEFLRAGWLRDLLVAAEAGAALVCAELLPSHPHAIEPVSHAEVYLASRPAPWLMLVDVARVLSLGISFKWFAQPSERPEGQVLYDTGGKLFAALKAAGLPWAEMPPTFRRCYVHYGNMSWAGRFGGSRRQGAKARRVERRLRQARRLTPGRTSGTAPTTWAR